MINPYEYPDGPDAEPKTCPILECGATVTDCEIIDARSVEELHARHVKETKVMLETFTLKDLDGRSGLTTAVFVRSRTAALQAVRNGRTVTAAGSNGAINIWREDRPGTAPLHAAFYRNLVTKSHVSGLTLTDLDRWLKEWWPSMIG